MDSRPASVARESDCSWRVPRSVDAVADVAAAQLRPRCGRPSTCRDDLRRSDARPGRASSSPIGAEPTGSVELCRPARASSRPGHGEATAVARHRRRAVRFMRSIVRRPARIAPRRRGVARSARGRSRMLREHRERVAPRCRRLARGSVGGRPHDCSMTPTASVCGTCRRPQQRSSTSLVAVCGHESVASCRQSAGISAGSVRSRFLPSCACRERPLPHRPARARHRPPPRRPLARGRRHRRVEPRGRRRVHARGLRQGLLRRADRGCPGLALRRPRLPGARPAQRDAAEA